MWTDLWPGCVCLALLWTGRRRPLSALNIIALMASGRQHFGQVVRPGLCRYTRDALEKPRKSLKVLERVFPSVK